MGFQRVKNKHNTLELVRQIDRLNVLLDEERRQNDATKNKVNGGYYMSSRKAEKNLRALQVESPVGSLVFSVLREHMKIGTNAVTISSSTLAKLLKRSLRTITRATKYLQDHAYVQVIKTGNTNTYIINEQISFAGSPGQRKAVFSATIVAHEDEQDEGWEKQKTLLTSTAPIDRRAPADHSRPLGATQQSDAKHNTQRRSTLISQA